MTEIRFERAQKAPPREVLSPQLADRVVHVYSQLPDETTILDLMYRIMSGSNNPDSWTQQRVDQVAERHPQLLELAQELDVKEREVMTRMLSNVSRGRYFHTDDRQARSTVGDLRRETKEGLTEIRGIGELSARFLKFVFEPQEG